MGKMGGNPIPNYGEDPCSFCNSTRLDARRLLHQMRLRFDRFCTECRTGQWLNRTLTYKMASHPLTIQLLAARLISGN